MCPRITAGIAVRPHVTGVMIPQTSAPVAELFVGTGIGIGICIGMNVAGNGRGWNCACGTGPCGRSATSICSSEWVCA